jgi:hypothetical protein
MSDFEVNESRFHARCSSAGSPVDGIELPAGEALPAAIYPSLRQEPFADSSTREEERLAADMEDWLMELFVPVVHDQRGCTTANGLEEHLPPQTPSVRRVRDRRDGHRGPAGELHAPRQPIGRGRRLSRTACPCGWRVAIVGDGGAPRERRQIWTRCHRERPSAIG